MKLKRSLLGILVAALLFSGCGLKDEETPVGVPTEQYNELVRKHNDLVEKNADLVDNGWKSSNAFSDYANSNFGLNVTLRNFSEEATRLSQARSVSQTEIDSFTQLYRDGVSEINKAQGRMIRQYNRLIDLAPSVYKRGATFLKRLDANNQEALSLDGIMAQHKALYDIVIDIITNPRTNATVTETRPAPQVEVRPVQVPERRIELSAQEEEVAQVNTGGAIFANSRGQVTSMTNTEFRNLALRRGFDGQTVSHTQTIASDFNGISGLACTNKDMIQVMNNLVSHMKARANNNSDDLEIVMAIDYSGSMSNNIRSVLTQLDTFMSSLVNVHNSGRDIKFGIVTFGKPGMEKIELSLTEKVSEVQRTLSRLLNDFGRKKHSTNPGEASLYGLRKAAKAQMGWKSLNRQTIMITDEGSYAMANNDHNFIRATKREVDKMNVYPLLVKLCN